MRQAVIIALAVIGTLATGYLIFGRQPSKPVQPEPFQPTNTSDVKSIYNQWKLHYKINVGAAEDEHRFVVFSTNYERIQEHNKLGKSYTLGLNAFTHLTQSEFAATHLGLKVSAAPKNTVKLPLRVSGVNIDWSEKMNEPKNQGQCGSCWAFSAVGAIEGAHVAINGNKLNLAEQELVDCAGKFPENNGCNGGLMDSAFQYVMSVGGLATEKDYPYTAADGECKTGLKRQGKISNFVDVKANSAEALKAALVRQPVAVAIEADTFAFQGYTGGVLNDDSCGTNLDHGVVAVGYNDADAQPYYKVRNSWGTGWGEKGHIRLAIVDGEGMCGIHKMASYPTL